MLGLYVHIPYCRVKCYYCDFAAFSGQKRTAGRYLRALEREARFWEGDAPETLYIGGGTPSELDREQVTELFGLIRRGFPAACFKEISFEANPESLDLDKIALLKELGVSRLSLGLQTPDDALLKSIGRMHTAADFHKAFREARAAGMSVSVDLMCGLPGQTAAGFRSGLREILDLEPEHLSLYGLQVEDRTLFARRGVEPDEDLCRAMHEGAIEALHVEGYEHYEISNFARPGYQSIHNQIYWRNGEYIGLGCGAASCRDGRRSTNDDRLIPYIEAAEAGSRPVSSIEELRGKDKLGETAMLGLRLVSEGVSIAGEMGEAFRLSWRHLEEQGLVRIAAGRARLTREGVFLANRAFSEFVPPYREVPVAA
jgi:oxygen-independent coproporphyrinogen-3 oxidase